MLLLTNSNLWYKYYQGLRIEVLYQRKILLNLLHNEPLPIQTKEKKTPQLRPDSSNKIDCSYDLEIIDDLSYSLYHLLASPWNHVVYFILPNIPE